MVHLLMIPRDCVFRNALSTRTLMATHQITDAYRNVHKHLTYMQIL